MGRPAVNYVHSIGYLPDENCREGQIALCALHQISLATIADADEYEVLQGLDVRALGNRLTSGNLRSVIAGHQARERPARDQIGLAAAGVEGVHRLRIARDIEEQLAAIAAPGNAWHFVLHAAAIGPASTGNR